MSDWSRNKELDATLGGQQYGQTASLVGFLDDGTGDIRQANVIRWGGDRWDVNAWRVYLSPWKPKAEMDITDEDGTIAADFPPVGIAPRMRPLQTISFASSVLVWAQIQWGSGGVQNTAWVDWPVAGLLLQVSGSYVQVNALAFAYSFEDAETSKLPDLPATLSDEPGGGDSARSATYTYPLQSLDWSTHNGINFPVVPFARACFFAWDEADAPFVTSALIEFIGPDGGSLEGAYTYEYAAGDVGDPREGVPLPPGTAYVRVTPTFSGATKQFTVGLSYELDL